MLDGVSLDQLRSFIAAVDVGSFSAAGRRLGRAQSVVSQAIATLETQLGVALFQRTGRYPRLTPGGTALLATARQVVRGADALKAQARSLAEGLEPELSVSVDVMFPQDVLTNAVRAFAERFADTPLRLFAEALRAVAQPLLDRRCSVGVMSDLPIAPALLERQHLLGVTMVPVAASSFPLAGLERPAPAEMVAGQLQLVLSDRSDLTQGSEFGVLATRTWRLADLGAKQAFLRAGLGWGFMPLPMVAEDLARGALVQLELEGMAPGQMVLAMYAVFRPDAPPGAGGALADPAIAGQRAAGRPVYGRLSARSGVRRQGALHEDHVLAVLPARSPRGANRVGCRAAPRPGCRAIARARRPLAHRPRPGGPARWRGPGRGSRAERTSRRARG